MLDMLSYSYVPFLRRGEAEPALVAVRNAPGWIKEKDFSFPDRMKPVRGDPEFAARRIEEKEVAAGEVRVQDDKVIAAEKEDRRERDAAQVVLREAPAFAVQAMAFG